MIKEERRGKGQGGGEAESCVTLPGEGDRLCK